MRKRMILAAALAVQGAAALAAAPRVVVDIAPVHGVVAALMQGAGTPVLLVPAGGDAHDFALRPSQARSLAQAQAVFWIGPGLMPQLQRPMDNLTGGAVIVPLMAQPGVQLLGADGASHLGDAPDDDDDHDKHADHDDHDDHAGHDHDADHDADHGAGHNHGAEDPHIWLDPRNVSAWLPEITRTLSALDPENAALYARNQQEFEQQLHQLEAQIEQDMAPLYGQGFMVYHQAYRYFEQRFGLRNLGAIAGVEGGKPSAAHMSMLRQIAKAQGVRCVLAEPGYNPGLIHAIGLPDPVQVDPLGGGLPLGPGHYPALLRDIAQQFAACLGAAGSD